MSESDYTHLTPVQRDALITPAMAAMMTATMQTQHQNMRDDHFQKLQQEGTARLPVDADGKTFSRFAACTVKQPVVSPTLPAALVGASCIVVGTSGERVKVRYLDGSEREFHKTELGVK